MSHNILALSGEKLEAIYFKLHRPRHSIKLTGTRITIRFVKILADLKFHSHYNYSGFNVALFKRMHVCQMLGA